MSTPDPIAGRPSTGRPHLGPRKVVPAALWPRLEALVDHARGRLDRSPYLADLLACHVDRQDLVRHHHQITMTLESVVDEELHDTTTTRPCTVRVHPCVADELESRARELGLARTVYLGYAIADQLGEHRPLKAHGKGLPLAM